MILEKRSVYEQVTGKDKYETALQLARIIIQSENLLSGRYHGLRRDQYWAENTNWILQHLGPSSKVVLSGHEYHLCRVDIFGPVVNCLEELYGLNTYAFATCFYSGYFNAVSRNDWKLKPIYSSGAKEKSYEDYFHKPGFPRFMLDLRSVNFDTSATRWLKGPHFLRAIGSSFDEQNPDSHYDYSTIYNDWDAIIFFDETNASTLLQTDGSQ